MRVISKYQDYFDRAGYIDQSIIFLRQSDEVEIDIPYHKNYTDRNAGLLGFCGKFYPYIHIGIDAWTDEKTLKYHEERHYYYYSFEDYEKSPFFGEDKKRRRFQWRSSNRSDYVNLFNTWTDSDELFVKLDAPYFKVKHFSTDGRVGAKTFGTVITNPILSKMQFGKIMDAPTAFQTIQFYLTNQLVKTKEPLEIEDKYRIAQHGFDKHSFRNPIRLKDLK